MSKILITGALGRLGVALTRALRAELGNDMVIAVDIKRDTSAGIGPVVPLSVLDRTALFELIQREKIKEIYHLAGEVPGGTDHVLPKLYMNNTSGLINVLDAAKIYSVKVFIASSIAVFGNYTQKVNCPQHSVTQPVSVYGISKAAGENWCQYYYDTYGVDVRSIRFPVIASPEFRPRGGSLDYLTEIFKAVKSKGTYICHIHAHTVSPVVYIEDAIRAIRMIMKAPVFEIYIRTAYNIQAMSFCPADIVANLHQQYPYFKVRYLPDHRQETVRTWPITLDDSQARGDWGWFPNTDLAGFMKAMLHPVEH